MDIERMKSEVKQERRRVSSLIGALGMIIFSIAIGVTATLFKVHMWILIDILCVFALFPSMSIAINKYIDIKESN
ncbi:hypothetical protein D3Z35_15690 [Enterococcus faecalis]|uniref:hypothetical protein n=1 Tax=Enterococcus faecalis TaxID=1351 RepID=UPI00080C36D2|nr:hypothetical protein [Enterococcus faecalis]ANU71963.1 hypothetical protein A4V06_02340 [Enterococcus faecalis]ASU26663.1 hypothetical protein ADH73_11680 [Enterococcus faecalis]MCO8259494.1 hypothetical protein [Enterococcus faecalis]MCP8907560.1 hypothetical protein [Enterococcus faecalis]MCP8910574.1 hypothetical protein [Enterococcus faecalis]